MLKNIREFLKSHSVIALAGLLILILAIGQFSERKRHQKSNFDTSNLTPAPYKPSNTTEHGSTAKPPSPPSPPLPPSQPKTQTGSHGGLASSCGATKLSPEDLLPNTRATVSGPNNVDKNFLSAGALAGINTVGSSLRNANLQIRSEPPNPKKAVSPWMNSTIEPDLMRVPLEIGCGSQ